MAIGKPRGEIDSPDEFVIDDPSITQIVCESILRTKTGSAYTTDDGREVPAHPLYIFDCSCGHRGAVWYASEARARRSWERHTHV